MTETEIQNGCADLVRREVYCCASYLISTFAQGYGGGGFDRKSCPDLVETCEQAFELACSIPDYEEAASQAGYSIFGSEGDGVAFFNWKNDDEISDTEYDSEDAAWRDCCAENNIEPYEREVFEHWIVSYWLGLKLTDCGEKVDFDFCNLVIWARTTTGQSISMDGVIVAIWKSLQTDELK